LRRLLFVILTGFFAFNILFGQNPIDSARIYFYEAGKANNEGDFERSEELLKRILNNGYALSDYREALIRNGLGLVYYQTSRLNQAIEQYRMAEDLLSKNNPDQFNIWISLHINKALYFKDLGDYSNSLFYNNEAFRLLNSLEELDPRSLDNLSKVLLNRGITYFHLGQFSEALEDLKECEKLKDEHNHPYQGSVYFNLARVCQRLGDYTNGQEYYLKSIDRWKSEYDSKHFELANIYLHFGQFLSHQGQSEQGREYLGMALQNYQENYGTYHPLTADCFESLATHCLDQGDWEGGLDFIQQALQTISAGFKSSDPFENPDLESSSHELTFLKILSTKTKILRESSAQLSFLPEKVEYLEAALATNKLSIDLLYKIRSSFLSSESRIYLNSKQKDLFTSGINLNLEMLQLSGKERFKEEAYMMAARGKTGELMFELYSKEWLYLESLTNPLALSTTDLKREMNHLSNLIQTATLERDTDSSHIAQMQNQLYQVQDSFNKNRRQLLEDFPNISQFEPTRTDFTLKQIRRSLKRNETLIEYFMDGAPSSGTEQLYTFVLTKKDCQVFQSDLDSTFYRNLQTMTRNLHEFVPYEETPERFNSLKQALFAMYQDLIQDLEASLNERNLIIVPDEELNYIPFDALITELEPESIANYAGVAYLLHKYNISYVYNSQLIAHSPSRFWRFPEVTAWIPGYAAAKNNTFDRLKGAEDEVQDIFDITPGRKVRKDMAKQDLMEVLEENSILHLAMHSLAADNTMNSPYFILDSVQDPLLTHQMHDYEINALRVASPMVVLSSCETAGGELRMGEGIMSLSRSFLQAGASSVIHSLWPVEDVKSRDIMVGFYREIKKGHSKSTALSRVKKQYISEQPPFYTHPYYWAALQITGNTSPLHAQRRASLGLGSVLLALLIFYGVKRLSFLRRN